MGRNPKVSKWYSTRRESRIRQPIRLTLAPEALAALDVMAGAGQRSAFVERLILQEYERTKR